MEHHYEIHITVNMNASDVEQFKTVCLNNGIKPIVLELENSDIKIPDMMTSSTIKGNDEDAFNEVRRVVGILEGNKFSVVRKKIEVWPFHPVVPKTANDKLQEGHYLEAHFSCIINQEKVSELKQVAVVHNAHFSKNIFAKLEDGHWVQMLTIRKNTNLEEFTRMHSGLLTALSENGIRLKNHRVDMEYAFYDTKQSHDSKWLSKN